MCYVEFRKAFDSVDHNYLWKKLVQWESVNKPWHAILQSMYSKAMSSLQLPYHEVTDQFHCEMGVRQGCNLSPLLFYSVHQWTRDWTCEKQKTVEQTHWFTDVCWWHRVDVFKWGGVQTTSQDHWRNSVNRGKYRQNQSMCLWVKAKITVTSLI